MNVSQLESNSNQHQRQDDSNQRCQQQLPPAQPLHQQNTQAAGGQIEGRDDGRGPDGGLGRGGADAGHADDGGGVVHEGVDAGGLLEDLQPTTDGEGAPGRSVLQAPDRDTFCLKLGSHD